MNTIECIRKIGGKDVLQIINMGEMLGLRVVGLGASVDAGTCGTG